LTQLAHFRRAALETLALSCSNLKAKPEALPCFEWEALKNMNYFFQPPEICQFEAEKAVLILSFGLQAFHFVFFESKE